MTDRRRPSRPPIAILTDFGYRDHYAGVLKGVIAKIAPAARVIDLAHGVAPQSTLAGALVLGQSWRYFPRETIFLAVVDPGVGTGRRPVAVETRAGARLVGPDNGLLWLAAREAGVRQVAELRAPRYRLSPVSATFHGRDIFAPAAAHLWLGAPLRSFGPERAGLEPLALKAPVRRGNRIEGVVIYRDGFGNLVTNLDRASVDALRACFPARTLLVTIRGGAPMGIVSAYGDAPPGAPLAVFGSFDLLEIAVREGSAAASFGAGEGTPVRVAAAARAGGFRRRAAESWTQSSGRAKSLRRS